MATVFNAAERISIHALREEGDAASPDMIRAVLHFYPRPPRGGRPALICMDSNAFCISIHALREEGDRMRPACLPLIGHFYPRPPRGGRRSVRCS